MLSRSTLVVAAFIVFWSLLAFSASLLSGCAGVTGSTARQTPSLPPLSISTSPLPGGIVGTAYSASLSASGGTPGYTWSITSGSLPPGLTMTASSGQISGTPSSAGTFSFTLKVTDSGSPTQSASQAFSIAIAAQSSGSPAPGPNDTIILQDGFETGDLSKWYVDGTAAPKFTVVTSPTHSGTHSLQAIPAQDTNHLIAWLNCPSDTNCPGYDEIYAKYYVYWNAGTTFDGHMTVVAGNQTTNRWSSFGKAGIKPSGMDYFYAGLDPEFQSQHGGVVGLYPFQFYSYWPGMWCPADYNPPTVTDCYGNLITQTGVGSTNGWNIYGLVTTPEPNTPGVWHEVVHRVKVNSIGNSDGLQEMWVDGVKVISQAGMSWRTSTALEINMFALEFYLTSAASGNAFVDDVTIWTPGTPGVFAAPDVYYNSFEFPDMRSPFTLLSGGVWMGNPGLVTMAPGEEPGQPAGVKTGANYGGNQTNSPVYVNDASVCHGGSWCVRYDAVANENGTIMYAPPDGSLINPSSHLFFRGFYKFQTGFTFSFGKLIYMRDLNPGANTIILVPGCPGGGPSCSTPRLFVDVITPAVNYECNVVPACTITGDGVWHSIEIEENSNGGASDAATLRLWLDRTLVTEYCPTCAAHATISEPYQPAQGFLFGTYVNGVANGGPCCNPTQSYWLDDLAVSTQRIGP